jgi:CubicO group peptidase (beta-lactamase class C family)/regulation of enolase protein 1 (concanavalin A-like superfamily)
MQLIRLSAPRRCLGFFILFAAVSAYAQEARYSYVQNGISVNPGGQWKTIPFSLPVSGTTVQIDDWYVTDPLPAGVELTLTSPTGQVLTYDPSAVRNVFWLNAPTALSGWTLALCNTGTKAETINSQVDFIYVRPARTDLPVRGTYVPELAQVDAQYLNFLRSSGVEAGSLAITYNRKLIYARSFGWQDFDRTQPIAHQPAMRLATASVFFTDQAVRKLVEDGVINWTDSIYTALGIPPLPGQPTPDARIYTMTVHDLMYGTNYFVDHAPSEGDVGRALGLNRNASFDEIIAYQWSQPLNAGPAWSHYALQLLGRLVEKKSHMPFADYIKANVTSRFGAYSVDIARTGPDKTYDDELSWYASNYFDLQYKYDFLGVEPTVPGPYSIDYEVQPGAGSLLASPQDFLRLMRYGDWDIFPVQIGGNYSYGWEWDGSLPGTTLQEWLQYSATQGTAAYVMALNNRNGSTPTGTVFNGLESTFTGFLQGFLNSNTTWPSYDLFHDREYGWTSGEIGDPGAVGMESFNNGQVTFAAAGNGIGSTIDNFYFLHQNLTGDGTILLHILNIENNSSTAQWGVMIRESLDPGSKHALLSVSSGSAAKFQYRNATNGTTSLSGSNSTVPAWLKIQRAGNVFTGSISTDGKTWTKVAQATITMASQVYIGVAANSGQYARLATAQFDQLALSGTGTLMPVTTGSMAISKISLSSGAAAVTSTVQAGSPVSPGSSFTWGEVATFGGATDLILPASDSANSSSSYLKFTLNREAKVVVLYDATATAFPTWLGGWIVDGVNPSWNGQGEKLAFYKYFPQGQVVLGGNRANGGNAANPYCVVIVPSDQVLGPAKDFFLERGGFALMEAEHATTFTAGSNKSNWVPTSDASASGGIYVKVPEAGQTYKFGQGAELNFNVEFVTVGPFNLWVRARQHGSSARNLYAAIDGSQIGSSFNVGSSSSWVWAHYTTPFTVSTPTLHTLSLCAEDDGLDIDQVLITADSTFDPTQMKGRFPLESPTHANR